MAARDKALWAEIRADYLATGLSYKKLAEKHGVPLSTLKKRAAADKWMKDREAVDAGFYGTDGAEGSEDETGTGSEPLVPTDAEILELRRDRLDRFNQATDAMMDRIIDALVSDDVISPYSLKLLASALRDLREMQGLNKSALDVEEQKARIEKLRRDTSTAEPAGAGGIIYMPVMSDRPEPPEDDDE